MLKLIIKQANWGVIGSVFAFAIGFFIKTYVIRDVSEYELIDIVSLFIIFMLYVNIMQFYYIKQEINITPFSSDLLLLVVISIPILYYSIVQDYTFDWYHYILMPIVSYIIYIVVFYKRLVQIISELK